MGALALVRGIVLLVGVGLLVGAVWSWQRTDAFVAAATAVHGTVIGLESSRSNDGGTTYRPRVRFQAADGRTVEFVSGLGSSPPAYELGEVVPVLYRADDPQGAEIGDFLTLWFVTLMLAGIGSVFSAIGIGMFVVPVLRDRRDAQLRATGQRVTARLVGVELNASVRVGNSSPWQVVAEWTDPTSGKVHELRSRNLWDDPTPALKGESVGAFVDPRDPRRHVLDLPLTGKGRG